MIPEKKRCEHPQPRSDQELATPAPSSDRHAYLRDITQREFVSAAGVVAGGMALGFSPGSVEAVADDVGSSADLVPVELSINGQLHKLSLDPRITLLDLFRENLGLTGTKKGCDHGQCGACTVLANGRRINSCLSFAVVHDGEQITTIEGIAEGDDLHPVQAAFIEHDGFQCGYCTPGQICSAVALLREAEKGDASFVTRNLREAHPVELTTEEIRERMSGNICRCGAYPGIVQAVQAARAREK